VVIVAFSVTAFLYFMLKKTFSADCSCPRLLQYYPNKYPPLCSDHLCTWPTNLPYSNLLEECTQNNFDHSNLISFQSVSMHQFE
jgi:hypothetical protein